MIFSKLVYDLLFWVVLFGSVVYYFDYLFFYINLPIEDKFQSSVLDTYSGFITVGFHEINLKNRFIVSTCILLGLFFILFAKDDFADDSKHGVVNNG